LRLGDVGVLEPLVDQTPKLALHSPHLQWIFHFQPKEKPEDYGVVSEGPQEDRWLWLEKDVLSFLYVAHENIYGFVHIIDVMQTNIDLSSELGI
jgi:hypothetical protein